MLLLYLQDQDVLVRLYMEIKDIFKNEILFWLNDGWEDNAANNLRKALLSHNVNLLQKRLNIFLKIV